MAAAVARGELRYAGSKWQRITAVEIQNSDTAVYSDPDHVRKYRATDTMTSQHKSGVTASDSALAEMRGGARQQHSRSDGPNRVVHRQYDLPPNFGHRRASARGSFPPSPSPSTLFFIRRQQLPRTILRPRPPSHFRIVMCIIHIYTIKLRSSSEEPTQLVGYLPRSTSLRPKQNLNHRKLLHCRHCRRSAELCPNVLPTGAWSTAVD